MKAQETVQSMVKCVTCGNFFEKKPITGILATFSRMLPNDCPDCQAKAQQEYEEDEKKRESEARRVMQELAAKRRKEYWTYCLGGEEAYQKYTFDEYETEPEEIPDEKHRATFRKWKQAMLSFNPLRHNLFVYGPVGTGKTHLATAKARWMLERGGTARVMEKIEFIAEVRGTKSYQPEAELLDNLKKFVDLDVMCLNDIEEEPNGPKANTIIKMLMELRMRAQKGGIIITSNKPPKTAIEYVGKKNVDRMDGNFLLFAIPEDTPSMRGILKRREKKREQEDGVK